MSGDLEEDSRNLLDWMLPISRYNFGGIFLSAIDEVGEMKQGSNFKWKLRSLILSRIGSGSFVICAMLLFLFVLI